MGRVNEALLFVMSGHRQREVGEVDPRSGIMELAYLELLRPSMILIMLVIAATAVGIFVVLGPMGTFEALTPLQRLLFGTLYAVIGWPIGYSTFVVACYFMRFRSPLEMVLGVMLVSLFSAIPCAAVVHTVETLVHPDYTAAAGLGRVYVMVATAGVANGLVVVYLVYQRITHSSALAAATAEIKYVAEAVTSEGTGDAPDGPVSTVAAAETDLARAAARARRSAPDDTGTGVGDPDPDESPGRSNGAISFTPEAPRDYERAERVQRRVAHRRSDGTPRGRFLGQLPTDLGDDVIYLKSEDHYVHVCTTAGSSLIKMRFADAIAALGDAGIRAHRSYWVALDHMQELTKRDRKLLLRLSGDHEAPVSARYLPAVRAALKLPPAVDE